MIPPAQDDLIWTGSYTAGGGGRADGIGALAAHGDGSLEWLGTAVKADSPSFLAVHPALPVVYAVAEQRGMVRAFRRTGDFGLEPLGDSQPAGDATCHVAVDPLGRFLTSPCWGDGQVLLYGLDDDGGMTGCFPAAPSVDPHVGLDPGEPRQSRAHASLMLADGRVMTTDLGHDTLRVWNYVPGTGLVADHAVALPFGSGDIRGDLPWSGHLRRPGSGRLRRGDPSGGNWPRHHLVRGTWLHVAHERSDNVATFALDDVTGIPTGMINDVQVPSPTALVPAPAPAGWRFQGAAGRKR
ncbi:beta-propeller fold lactonase family protein [Pseudarthrobacter oxydans]|uniref:lactonase family protein n=1 Tax=Pseudarthrobacter oxydans TaxID=1671 RepID=UPI002AA81C63|nr:beta-propeller fold lactonase family protein [Pseudarthrobacter oxydans]WPU09819.1 beta-propeller fold lactonase family protein [Pseudarthrobacter oxydans]